MNSLEGSQNLTFLGLSKENNVDKIYFLFTPLRGWDKLKPYIFLTQKKNKSILISFVPRQIILLNPTENLIYALFIDLLKKQ